MIVFGTSPYRPEGRRIDMETPVRIALEVGYRHFDVAEMYGNELAVGRALRSAPRNELQIIGKVWRTNFRPEHLLRACKDSLARLGIDAFDLYLLHAPEAWRHVAPLDDAEVIGWEELERRALPREDTLDDVPLQETWNAMRGLIDAGLTREIGVSNFTPRQIETLREHQPSANQIPCWPFDESVIAWHARRGIRVFGYSPLQREKLASSGVPDLLHQLLQSGIVPVTSSANPEHIRQSFIA